MAKEQKSTELTTVIVRIYGVSKKWKVKPFYSCPAFDTLKQVYRTGQENLSASQLEKEPFLIDPMKHIIVRDGDQLTLQRNEKGEYLNTVDYVKYRYFRDGVPEIANNKDDVNKSKHYFYLENKEEEAVQNISIGKLRGKAYEYIKDVATLSDMRDIIFYLGQNATNYTNNLAESYLYDKCNTEPQKIVGYFEDDTRTKIVFVKKCLTHKLLTRSASNYIMYGSVVCGANEMEAAAFLYIDNNSTVYNQLYDQLSKIEGK